MLINIGVPRHLNLLQRDDTICDLLYSSWIDDHFLPDVEVLVMYLPLTDSV